MSLLHQLPPPMAAAPSHPEPAEGPSRPEGVPHAAGAILDTACPSVAVLVEHDQRRLIAAQPIAARTVIFTIEGRESRTPTRYSVQVAGDLHIDSDDLPPGLERARHRYWMYLNHHCQPSAWVRGREVVALRDIAPGEGVTFDYNTTEGSMASPFACHCGAAECLGEIRGANHLSPAERARVAPYLADYLR